MPTPSRNPKSNESFVVLTQSQVMKKSPPNRYDTPNGVKDGSVQRRKTLERLFDAISGRSDVDYPMCTECAEILLEYMGGKHAQVKKERDGYLEFIKGLQIEGQIMADEKAAAERELEEVCLI